jgi:hypothetical protein
VAEAEEVEVLPVACGALDDPGPWALLAFLEGEICGVEQGVGRVVDQRPAGARNQARLDGLAGPRAERAVEGARGAFEVFGVGEARVPGDGLAVDREFDGEIVRSEAAVA